MKSQFKRADASGARFALVFGADELARGDGRRQAAARRAAPRSALRPLADAAGLGARVAHRIIASFCPPRAPPSRGTSQPNPHTWPPISTCKSRNNSTR